MLRAMNEDGKGVGFTPDSNITTLRLNLQSCSNLLFFAGGLHSFCGLCSSTCLRFGGCAFYFLCIRKHGQHKVVTS